MKIQLISVPLVLLMLITSTIVMATPNQKSQSIGVIFENVRIFNGTAAELSAPSNVLIAGNQIKSISTQAIPDPVDMKLTRIQGDGRTLMPGLIDNHVHLFMTGSNETVMLNPKTSVDKLNATTVDEAKKMLLRGFTAVRDVGGPVFDAKKSIDSGKSIGPRIYPSGAMISQTSGHGDFRMPHDRAHRFGGEFTKGELLGVGFIADGRDEVLTATRENLRAGASQIKVMAGGGQLPLTIPWMWRNTPWTR